MEKHIKLQEMRYEKTKGKYSVLSFGERKGRHFFIVSVGGEWPTAYVEAKPGEDRDFVEDLFNGKTFPHGGLTYGPEGLLHLKDAHPGADIDDSIFALKYWGWDYGHLCDYCTWKGDPEYSALMQPEDLGDKHTVDEIYENDVIPFIDLIEKKSTGQI